MRTRIGVISWAAALSTMLLGLFVSVALAQDARRTENPPRVALFREHHYGQGYAEARSAAPPGFEAEQQGGLWVLGYETRLLDRAANVILFFDARERLNRVGVMFDGQDFGYQYQLWAQALRNQGLVAISISDGGDQFDMAAGLRTLGRDAFTERVNSIERRGFDRLDLTLTWVSQAAAQRPGAAATFTSIVASLPPGERTVMLKVSPAQGSDPAGVIALFEAPIMARRDAEAIGRADRF